MGVILKKKSMALKTMVYSNWDENSECMFVLVSLMKSSLITIFVAL